MMRKPGGEVGPAWLLAQNLSKPDLAIAAGFSFAVVNAHNGCLHLEVTVTGKSAHAAMPATGADALEAANAILTALYKSRVALSQTISAIAGIGAPQITVGLIEGGINTNVVPDRIVFRLDRRVIPDETMGHVEAGLIREIEQAAANLSGITVEIKRILSAEPLKIFVSGITVGFVVTCLRDNGVPDLIVMRFASRASGRAT